MKNVGQFILDQLDRKNTKVFMLVKINLYSNQFLVTSLPYKVYFQGEPYSPAMGIVSFAPPKTTTSLDKQTYELVIQDASGEHQTEIKNGVTGKEVSIFVGFLDNQNKPRLDSSNLFVAYEGMIESAAIALNKEEKLAKYKLSSPMAALDARSGYLASKAAMGQINPNDTCFDEIYIGVKNINYSWGKT
jgi:hypothetical protein